MATDQSLTETVNAADRRTNPITLTRFILQERAQYNQATGQFTMLLQSIQLACKAISKAVNKAGISGMYGLAGGETNTSGDVQKKLDVFANEIFLNCLKFSGEVHALVTEEQKEPVFWEDQGAGYAVVFDPLDGSSNIDANVSVGTIFGIYKKEKNPDHKPSEKDVLKSGNQLVAAGYALYGASTMIVLSTGLGVNGFLLDPSLGEFILTHQNIRIPKKGKIYSINEGNAALWDAPTRAYVESCKQLDKNGKPKTARYIGSMVADVHRTLLYGGVFMYPADKTNKNGKLRLLYECNPMAFLVEQAGGRATNGTQRILDLKPQSIHQRSAIFLGSPDDVKEIENLYKTNSKL